MLTGRGRAFLAAGVVLLLGGMGLGFGDLTRVGLLILVLPLLALGLARRPLSGLRVSREVVPSRVTVGEPCELRVQVRNTGRWSTPPLLAQERLGAGLVVTRSGMLSGSEDLPRSAHSAAGSTGVDGGAVADQRARFVISRLAPGQARSARIEITPSRRGVVPLGPLSVWVRDPFGLSRRDVAVPGAAGEELLVLPRVHPLTGSPAGGAGTGSEGELPHLTALSGEDDQTLREYRDGDDLRRIHWPATARVGTLMVRQEEEPARQRAVLVLDSRSAGYGSGRDGADRFDTAVEAAASIAAQLHVTGHATYVVTRETAAAPADAELPLDLEQCLETLARAHVGSDAEQARVHEVAATLAGRGGLLVALVAGSADPQTVLELLAARPLGGRAVALVLDGAAPTPTGALPAAEVASMLETGGWAAAVVGPDFVGSGTIGSGVPGSGVVGSGAVGSGVTESGPVGSGVAPEQLAAGGTSGIGGTTLEAAWSLVGRRRAIR